MVNDDECGSSVIQGEPLSGIASNLQQLDPMTALADVEERFRLLVENVQDYAIFLLDSEGYIISWNRGAERLKGYKATEILGQHFSVFYPVESVEAGKPDYMLRMATEGGRSEDEGWRIRKDGTRFWAHVNITALRDAAGSLRGFAKVTRDMTARMQYEESLRKITGQLLSLQDQERRRIARELHDSTAQSLGALSINLQLLQTLGVDAHNSKAARILSDSQALAEQAAQEIRDLSHLLHPPDLDAVGLVPAICGYVQKFVARTGIQVDLNVPETEIHLAPDAEIALFRIVQEGLTNVSNHSGSLTAAVRVERSETEVVVKIQDQGRGIPPHILQGFNKSAAVVGIGLVGMEERVRQLAGQLKIDSGSHGTTITVTINVDPAVSRLSTGQSVSAAKAGS
jgi:PAS domain S-box-containing protein